MKKTDCRFCNIWEGTYANEFDKPIAKVDNYLSVVSLGSFVNGWSLVIPREHVYSMRYYYSEKEFWNFVNHVGEKLRNVFGKRLIVFEHGANRCDSETSCGTHHAHLHIVPSGKSILTNILSDRNWEKVNCRDILNIVGEKEYLLYADFDTDFEKCNFYIHILEEPESQYFRRILGKVEGIADYSYKTAPYIEKTKESFQTLEEND